MQHAIATVSLSGALDEKLEAIAVAGFQGVEIFDRDLHSFAGTAADVRSMAKDLGLTIISLQPFRDFEGMPDDMRAQMFHAAEREFDLMDELGCDLLMICSNASPKSLGGIGHAAQDLAELGELAARRGKRIGFEALSWGVHICDYHDAWEAVRRADHPAVGLVLDAFHIMARKSDLSGIRAVPADRLFLVQVSDAPDLELDYLSWSRGYRCFPGQGSFQLIDFMDALAATGYRGPLSLEIFAHEDRAGSARSAAQQGRRSLISLLDKVRVPAGDR